MIVLNEGQNYAYQNIVSYILDLPVEALFEEPVQQDNDYEFILLEGYAGTGKTTTVNSIIETCLKESRKKVSIAITATTHKAVKVLKSSSQFQEHLEFSTIHSLCGLKQQINSITGEVTYVPEKAKNKPPRIADYKMLIIDEVSMLNKDLFDIIIDFHKRYRFKILFIGDSNQIPPVKEVGSLVFNPLLQRKHNIGVYRLETVMRQALDNPIIAFATAIRTDKIYDGPKSGNINFLTVSKEDVYPVLEKYFLSEEYKQDPDYIKVLSYTNKVAIRFNTIIREMIYGRENLPKILIGDRLIAEKPIMLMSDLGWMMKAATNTELRVVDIQDPYLPLDFEYSLYGEFPTTIETNDQAIEVYDILSEFWKHKLMHHDFATGSINVPVKKWEYKTVVLYAYRAVLNFVDDPNKSVIVNILHETSEALYNEVVNKVKNNAVKEYDKEIKSRLWRQFYTMQNQFAEVGYDYALTVHKSQGSTYKNCLVHKWDINTNPKPAEKKSLTYVAVTRAKENLYVVG